MKSRFYIFALALASIVLMGACGCENKGQDITPTPKDTTVAEPEDMIWSKRPYFNIPLENTGTEEAQMAIHIRITTDMKQLALELKDTLMLDAGAKKEYAMTTPEDLAPGFYRALCLVNGKTVRNFVFGIDPFDIVSAPDKQPDFDAYWQGVKDQLAAVDMNAQLTEITSKSTAARKVYLVEMYSVPDGLSGDPVKIRGYYCEPQDGQKHPAGKQEQMRVPGRRQFPVCGVLSVASRSVPE